MWLYWTFYPSDTRASFSLAGRVNEVFARTNENEHDNNYSTHKGFGTGKATSNTYEDRAIKDGRAVTSLPNAHHTNSPYIEVVWNPPGMRPGATRFIYNQNNLDEMYFTDSHYTVYWKVWGQQNTHVVFPS